MYTYSHTCTSTILLLGINVHSIAGLNDGYDMVFIFQNKPIIWWLCLDNITMITEKEWNINFYQMDLDIVFQNL